MDFTKLRTICSAEVLVRGSKHKLQSRRNYLQTTYSMKELYLEYRENLQNSSIKTFIYSLLASLIFSSDTVVTDSYFLYTYSFVAHLLSFKSFIFYTFINVFDIWSSETIPLFKHIKCSYFILTLWEFKILVLKSLILKFKMFPNMFSDFFIVK